MRKGTDYALPDLPLNAFDTSSSCNAYSSDHLHKKARTNQLLLPNTSDMKRPVCRPADGVDRASKW